LEGNRAGGEEFVNTYFDKLKANAKIDNFQWESQENAVAPYDFSFEQGTRKSFLDVKATSGGFERNIHLSFPELLAMRDSAEPYYIYRVYDVQETSAKLRISKEMRAFADSVLKVLAGLPNGVNSDGISVSPSVLDFAPEEQSLAIPDG
jgi:Domain of unknown function (DUF3883)